MKNPRSLTIENTKYKTDRFTLHQESPGRWKVSGRDSEGLYRRIRFNAQDLSEAVKMAEEILRNPGWSKSQSSNPQDESTTLRISEALIRAAKTRNWTEYTRKNEIAYCEYFLKWVDQKGLQYWPELRLEHVLEYKKHLIKNGCVFDTVRLYLRPIRQTSAWMSANWPKQYVDICRNFKLSRKEFVPTRYDENRGNPYLSIHQVLDFLDWLARDSERDCLTVGVALQSLVSLQLQEAYRLTWDKIDLHEEAITIDGVVKNFYRLRKIPIPTVMVWLLRRVRNIRANQALPNQIYTDFNNYAHALRRELAQWNPYVKIKPKDLRNTLQTEAIDGGWYGYYVQRYVGHAPQTIGERHYHGDQGKRLIPLFREKVVSHIEAEIANWKAPADTPILPGPRTLNTLDYC